ncbi:AEC family transporter [Shimazuella kribbensis]|uniref:AEC family transporter n=1 Tax=Shimazuella kribbensis TaxID=139808 RepID=UPI0004269B8F|nr:AEC family transporter [Shimazuella kribbensis]
MNFVVMIQSVLMMASMLGIGALLTKKVNFNEDTRTLLTTLIVSVAVPCVIVGSFFQLPHEEGLYGHLLIVFAFSLGTYAISLFLTWWLGRLLGMSKFQSSQMAVISAQGNTGFIGLPLCLILFGSKGVILAAVFDTGVGISLWTMSVMVINHRYSITLRSLKPMINIPLIAFFVGLLLSIFQFDAPETLLQFLLKLGALASPLALIYIGFFLPKLFRSNKQTNFKPLIIGISIKLLVVPLITIGILSSLPLDKLTKQVILLMSTMPTGSMVPILFAHLKADEEFGAQATVFATITSLLTIPLMYGLGSWILSI